MSFMDIPADDPYRYVYWQESKPVPAVGDVVMLDCGEKARVYRVEGRKLAVVIEAKS